jgi:heme exporter protein C
VSRNWLQSSLQLSSPARFHALARRVAPWFAAIAGVLACAGLFVGFAVAPTDAQQGEVYRIIYIHLPAAWMSMFLYLVAGGYAVLALVFRTKVSAIMLRALLPTGAMFTAAALVTGAIWGKPTWGTYWVWDARLTSELILLFIYLGLIALGDAIEDVSKSDRALALFTLAGVINIPIIYFSVRWWNTLHQGASISMTAAPKMAGIMVTGILLMSFAAWAYSAAVVLTRATQLIEQREAEARWISEMNANDEDADVSDSAENA